MTTRTDPTELAAKLGLALFAILCFVLLLTASCPAEARGYHAPRHTYHAPKPHLPRPPHAPRHPR